MSATSGTFEALTMSRNARVESSSGQDTRTMSAPASSSSRTWPIVAWASAVRVLVIDWTVIGASPPTATLPTMIWRLLRRWIERQGRSAVWSWTWSLTWVWGRNTGRNLQPPTPLMMSAKIGASAGEPNP